MGFECSFQLVEKYGNVQRVEDWNVVEAYLEWKNNPWNHEEGHYPTFEKYWNAFFDSEYPGEPDKEVVNFYDVPPQGWYSSYATFIDSWCSSGHYIDEFIVPNLKKVDEYTFVGIDNEFINKGYKWVDAELEECKLIPVIVTKSFRDNPDGTTTLIPCDGILAEDEDGNQRLINTSAEEWGEYIYIPSKYYDESKHVVLTSFRDALSKLALFNPNDYIIWYSRSY